MKHLIFTLCIFVMPLMMYADPVIPVPLIGGIVNPTDPFDPHPKSPMLAPAVYQDGNTLIFDTLCDGMTLELRDVTGNIVYTLVIPVGTTQMVLPTYLSGTYELRLISSTYYFYGYITL